jgi:hypothetical protein
VPINSEDSNLLMPKDSVSSAKATGIPGSKVNRRMERAMDLLTTSSKRDYGNHGMEPVPESVFWNVSQYRLDDRIRQLRTKVVASSDHDLGPFISELKAALRERNERLRNWPWPPVVLEQSDPKRRGPIRLPLTTPPSASQTEP